MKVFSKFSFGRGTIICQPSNDVAAAECLSEWRSAKGVPIQFVVKFADGVAEVPDHLGKYLVTHGLAFRTPNH